MKTFPRKEIAKINRSCVKLKIQNKTLILYYVCWRKRCKVHLFQLCLKSLVLVYSEKVFFNLYVKSIFTIKICIALIYTKSFKLKILMIEQNVLVVQLMEFSLIRSDIYKWQFTTRLFDICTFSQLIFFKLFYEAKVINTENGRNKHTY